MKFARQRGGLMIELAFASLGLAFFIVGATDVARIFQARGAVQAAVQEGLRCVYPLDASCGSVVANPPAPILFDVSVGKRSMQYAIQQEFLTTSAQWGIEQRWRAPVEMTAVESVTVDEPQRRYVEQEVLYPVDAHAVYVFKTRDLPLVAGGEALSPTFFDSQSVPNRESFDADTATKIDPNLTIGLEGIGRSTRRRARPTAPNTQIKDADYYDVDRLRIGQTTFSVQDAWRGSESLSSALELMARHNAPLRCYQSPVSSVNGGSVVQWAADGEPEPCMYRPSTEKALFEGGTLKVPLMFRVSGRTNETEALAANAGSLVMLMEWTSPTAGSGSKKLGGRLISAGASGNFVVRGASSDDLVGKAGEAHNEYMDEINKYGTLPLIPIDASVTLSFFLSSKDGTRVAWWGDDMQVFFPTFQLVKQTFPCGPSPDPTECRNKPKKVAVSYYALSATSPVESRPVGNEVCSLEQPANFEKDRDRVLEQLKSQILAGITPPRRTFSTLAPNAASCADVSTTRSCPDSLNKTALQGCQAEEWPQEKILRECGFSSPLPRDAKLRVKYRTSALGTSQEFGECSGPPLPSCALPHRKDAGTAILKDRYPLCTGQVVRAPVETSGPYAMRPCLDSGYNEHIERYRAKHNIPAGIQVAAVTSDAPDLITEEKPVDSCLVVSESEVRKEVQCAAKVTSAVVEACCREANGDCRYNQAPGGRNGSADSMRVVFNQAIGRTVETIQAAFPAANYRQSCSDTDPYCLQVSGDLVDNNARARMSAQVHVPLTLLKAVGWQGTTVSYEETRVLERARIAGGDFVN
jgi:hypothetical protein